MKRLSALMLTLVLLLCMLPAASAASAEATAAADKLYELGLFNGKGTDANGKPIYALDDVPTRHEAVTMLVRLLGKEAEAKAGNWVTPFTDVDAWAKPYVGYAYANGLTAGTGDGTTFSGTDKVNATQYLTFVLRALGYSSSTDFQWNKAWELSDKLGFTDGRFHSGNPHFTRGDIAVISASALNAKLKGSNDSLLAVLEKAGAVTLNKPAKFPSPVDKLTFNLTSGKPAGVEQPILYTCHNTIPPEDAVIHQCTTQALDNGYTRIRVLYTLPYDLPLYIANYPNYSVFNAKPGATTGNYSCLVFDIKNSVLEKCDTIMCNFGFGSPDYSTIVYLNVGDNAGIPLTSGKPTGAARSVEFSGSVLQSCTAQPLDNGYIRITAEHTAPGGLSTYVWENDNQKLSHDGWLFADERGTSGEKKQVVFDLKEADLANMKFLSLMFCASGAYPNTITAEIYINGKEAAASQPNAPTSLVLTDGKPTGEVTALDYTEHPELASGTGAIHSVTTQTLDNGYTRFSLDYTMPEGLRIFVFDPPNGEKVSQRDDGGTVGSRATLVFDVETALLSEIPMLSVNFFRTDNDRFFVSIPLSAEEESEGYKITLTDGKPVGPATAVKYISASSLSAGKGTAHSLTRQALDNGHTRFTLDYSAPAGLNILVYDVPNGEAVSQRDTSGTAGGRDTLVFDVETALLPKINTLVVNIFHAGDDCFLIEFRPNN